MDNTLKGEKVKFRFFSQKSALGNGYCRFAAFGNRKFPALYFCLFKYLLKLYFNKYSHKQKPPLQGGNFYFTHLCSR